MEAIRGQFPNLRKLWVDKGYRGLYWMWLRLDRNLMVEVVQQDHTPRRPDHGGRTDPAAMWRFHPAPRRWVVERTFAWFGRSRRLSKDYEYLPETSEALIYAAMSHRMVRRLARGGHPIRERRGQPWQLPLPLAPPMAAA